MSVTKSERQKPGRKPKPETEREKSRTTIRATDQEWKAIKSRAAKTGRSISRYLVAVGTRDGQPATQEERKELSQLLFEIHKAGVNLNQIAARLHQQTGAISVAQIENAITETRAAARAIRERMKA
jgi:hypothetical protein